MGSAIAARLERSGQAWIGYDPARPELAPAPDVVLRRAKTVILCLPDSAATARLLPVIGGARVIIDTTTGDPDQMAAFGAAHENYLDVTIGGSSAHLRDGEAILMAGATAPTFEAARPILAMLSDRVFHCGPPGSGARMKLVFNLVLGLNRAALAEGLAFAEACGLEAGRALEILQSGPAASKIMDRKGRKMVEREYEPEARLAQHLKDVRLMLAQGEHRVELPLTAAHKGVLERAVALGYGESDNSALIEAYRNDSVSNE